MDGLAAPPPKDKEPVGGENDSFVDNDFLVKNTRFEGKQVSFCVQSFDGPCPLLAMANVLLLRNKLRIKQGSDRLTTKHVLTLVGDEIVCLLEKRNVVENDLESCLSELRKLQGGLQVNVSFSGAATAFELTTGFRLFQLLGIQVVHGWIPEDEETKQVLQQMTYNDAVELIALADEYEMKASGDHDNNVDASKIEMVHRAAIAKRFLDSSPSQLTFEGLFKIHAALADNELAVLFRNNHFSTIIKRKDALYTLVTDIGFLHKTEVVWETLDCVSGDTNMVNCDFVAPALPPIAAASAGNSTGFDIPSFDLGLGGVEAENDAEVARRIQAQSDAEFARSLQNRMDSTDRGPVGELRSVGFDEDGREVLEDERGHRFVRKKKAKEEEKKEEKCVIC